MTTKETEGIAFAVGCALATYAFSAGFLYTIGKYIIKGRVGGLTMLFLFFIIILILVSPYIYYHVFINYIYQLWVEVLIAL